MQKPKTKKLSSNHGIRENGTAIDSCTHTRQCLNPRMVALIVVAVVLLLFTTTTSQGERRFWLGAMVDDLFLTTNVFSWDNSTNEGTEVRMVGADLTAHLTATAALNAVYSSDIVTEFPFNANGILDKVIKHVTIKVYII